MGDGSLGAYPAAPAHSGDWSFLGAALTAHREPTRPPVRFGSLADITARSRHVRFTPDSGHSSAQVGCPLSANSGHHLFFSVRVKPLPWANLRGDA